MPYIIRILALPSAIAAVAGAAGLIPPGLVEFLIVALPIMTAAMLLIATGRGRTCAEG